MNKLLKLPVFIAATMLLGCSLSPEALTYKERQDFLAQDLKLQEKFNIPVSGPITISEAMARTVAANIEHRTQMLEHALSQKEFEQAKREMLPSLKALGAVSHRSPQSASRSINVDTGEVSTGGYTSSEERTHELGDITFSWNLLDFGLSYYQAKQQADAVLIRQEMERSVLHNLLFKVRNAYWKAYFAQLFSPKIQAFIDKSKKALEDSRSVESQRLMPPLEALQYQKGLLGVIGQMEDLEFEMEMAKVELRSLMNLPPNAELILVAPGEPGKISEKHLPALSSMIEVALDQRPELRQAMYRTRSSLNEVKKAYIRTLPGLEFRTAFNFDSNTYLRDNSWWNIWGGLTANIVDMLTAPQRISLAEKSVEMSDYRRLGMHLAVILQVQMAVKQLENATQTNNRTIEMYRIDSETSRLIEQKLRSTAATPMESIKAEAAALLAELNEYKSCAGVQNAMGALMNSMGLDMIEIPDVNASFADIVKSFERQATIQDTDISRMVEEVLARNQREQAETVEK